MNAAILLGNAVVAAWIGGLCLWIHASGRKVARRMDAECNGMSWTGQNGRRYQWRDGRCFDVATGRRVAL